jgi:type VI secretion system protein ImpL
MMETLADAGAKQSQSVERDVLNAELKPIADFCQRAVANRYPFAAGSRADVLPEDFGQLFGQGGMLDDFFNRGWWPGRHRQATWAYKPLPDGTRPSPGRCPTSSGPRASARPSSARAARHRASASTCARSSCRDGLKEITIDIDGQAFKLTAGGQPVTLSWPSQRVASRLTLSTSPGATPQVFDGPWGLFRMFERFEIVPTGQPERFGINMNLEGSSRPAGGHLHQRAESVPHA